MAKVTKIPLTLDSFTSYDIGGPDAPSYPVYPIPANGKIWVTNGISTFEINEDDVTLNDTISVPLSGETNLSNVNNKRFANLVRHKEGGSVVFRDVISKNIVSEYTFTSSESSSGIVIYKNKVLSSFSFNPVTYRLQVGIAPVFKYAAFKIYSFLTNVGSLHGSNGVIGGTTKIVGDGSYFDNGVLYFAFLYHYLPIGGYNPTPPTYTNNPSAVAYIHLVGIVIDDLGTVTKVLEEDIPAKAWNNTLYEGFEAVSAVYCAPDTANNPNDYIIVIETTQNKVATDSDSFHLYVYKTATSSWSDGEVSSTEYQRSFFLYSHPNGDTTAFSLLGASIPAKGDVDTDHILAISVEDGFVGTTITDLATTPDPDLYLVGSPPIVYSDQKFGFQTFEINIADPLSIQADQLPNSCSTSPYNALITVQGGFPPYTLTENTSILPASFSFVDNGDGTGTLSGSAPNEIGLFSITIDAEDSQGNTASQELVFELYQSPSIDTTTLPDGQVNIFYDEQIIVS